MKDLSTSDPLMFDIGTLIDEALADPARASAVKARIRARLAERGSTLASPVPAQAPEADAEDLWENVPL